MVSNLNKHNISEVRRPVVDHGLTYEEMSPLGKKLHDIAREIESSDEPGYSEEDIQKELAERRGGHSPDAYDTYIS